MADTPYTDEGLPGGTASTDAAAPAEKPVGPFQRPDDELVKQINKWLKAASAHRSKRVEERGAEWEALSGKQWADTAVTRMNNQKRTVLTLNLLQTMMAAVEGEERSNRQEIKFYGEEQGDDKSAQLINRLVRWIMDGCGGEFSLSQMFRAGTCIGEGWVQPTVDFFDDPEGQIKLEFIDEDEMFADPQSKSPTASDAKMQQRARMIGDEEVEARWPGKLADICAKAGMDDITSETDGRGYRDVYLAPGDTKSPKVIDSKTKEFLIVETWWSQIEPGVVMVDEATNELVEMQPDEFEQRQVQRKAEQQAALSSILSQPQPVPGMMEPPQLPPNLQGKPRPIRRLYQAFTCGDVLLEKRPNPVAKMRRFPQVRFGALFDKKNGTWYGLLKGLLDVQKQHNVEQSAIIQLIQQMPHASWMAPKGAYHNKTEWEAKLAQTGKLLEYNAQRGKPEQIQTPAVPRHLIELAASRPAAMREISGVNVEMTGARGNADAGVIMEMRKKAASTVLAPLFDTYRMAKLELGKVLLCFIQTYIPVGRRVRVLGKDSAATVQMTEDASLGTFDLKVEEANASVNDRISTLTVMQTTLPALMNAGVPIPASMVKLLPIDTEIQDEMYRMISWQQLQAGQLPPPDWQPGMPNPSLAPPAQTPGAPPMAPPPGPPQQ